MTRDNRRKLEQELNEHASESDYWDYDDDDYWDWDWSEYYTLCLIPSMPRIAPGSDGYIIEQLGNIKRDHDTPKSFKQFRVGSFLIIVNIELLNNKYILPSILDYNKFSVTLNEDDSEVTLPSSYPGYSISQDFRFKMKPWANKFNGIVGKDITLLELVDLIKRCLRVTELKFME